MKRVEAGRTRILIALATAGRGGGNVAERLRGVRMRREGDSLWSPVLRRRRQRSVEMEEDVVGGGGWRASLSASKAARIERFKQQTMGSVTVTYTPRTMILLYLCIGVVFIPIGATIFAGSLDVRDAGQEIEYSSRCGIGTNCMLRFEVKRTIAAPSYLYYVITNMMQNYLTYARSRSHLQLRGGTPQFITDVMDCCPKLFKPFANGSCTNKSHFVDDKNGFNLTEIRNPCGLAAWSLFNDSYTLCRDSACDTVVKLSDRNIAWSTDANKYRPGEAPHFSNAINRLLQSERFRVWMRLSGFPRIEKLWARIEEDLAPGVYYMRINSRYNVKMFGGEKYFFISGLKWFGAKNLFLGILYIITGLLCMLIALVMLGTHIWYPRKPAHFDPDLLKAQLEKLSEEQKQNERSIQLPTTDLNGATNNDHRTRA